MRILDRYIYTKTTIYFLIIFPSFTIISGLIELVELLRKVKEIDLKLIFLYIISKTPENSYYIVPVSLLVAVFVVILDMKKSREIYPILTSGISINYLNLRFLLFSLLITALQLINLELIMPRSTPLSESIYLKLKNTPEDTQKTIVYNVWLKLKENSFLYFDVYDFFNKTGKGLILLEFDRELRPTRRVEAELFGIDGKTIKMENSKSITINSMSDIKIVKSHGRSIIQIEIEEKEIYRLVKSKKPISLTDVYKVAYLAKKYGYGSSYFLSKFFQKLATLFSPVVLLMFAVSFFWEKEYYKIGIGFISIVAYWYGTALITAITEGGKLPYISIFVIDFVFMLVGYLKIRSLKYIYT